MPQLDYFRLHYLGKIWIVGIICFVILTINFFYDKYKVRKFEISRKEKELQRKQMLIERKKSSGII